MGEERIRRVSWRIGEWRRVMGTMHIIDNNPNYFVWIIAGIVLLLAVFLGIRILLNWKDLKRLKELQKIAEKKKDEEK